MIYVLSNYQNVWNILDVDSCLKYVNSWYRHKTNLESKAIEQKKMVICNKKAFLLFVCFFCMSALTSYFCLFSFSPRSNFSASSCIIHCQSSLAFSLREPIRSFVSGHSPHHQLIWLWWLTSVYLQTGDRRWVSSFCLTGSSSSSLSPSVSSPPCGPHPARQDWWCLIHFYLVLLQ